MSASFVNQLARDWSGRLSHYAAHRNDEHRLALLEEAARYTGLHLENDLCALRVLVAFAAAPARRSCCSSSTGASSSGRPAAGAASTSRWRSAESWCEDQPSLRPYRGPILEFLNALRLELQRRAHSWHV